MGTVLTVFFVVYIGIILAYFINEVVFKSEEFQVILFELLSILAYSIFILFVGALILSNIF